MNAFHNRKKRIIFSIAMSFVLLWIGIPIGARQPSVRVEEKDVLSVFNLGLKMRYPVPVKWKNLAPGFDCTILKYEGERIERDGPLRTLIKRRVQIVVFRVDPVIYSVRVVTAADVFGRKKSRLPKLHEKVGAVLTINGGFFHGSGDPVGLVISDGRLVSEYDEEDGGSGAFAVYGNILRIGWAENVAAASPPPDHALQNGPLLINPGGAFGINVVSDFYYHRTIVGIDSHDRLLVAVTRKIYGNGRQALCSGINLFEAAAIFYNSQDDGGLGAKVALNLDGGTSTGMRLTLGEHRSFVRVHIDLPNFVCIMPK